MAQLNTTPEINYTYAAKLDRVIDGDTAVLLIDLGFYASTTQHIRFQGYNAPELHGSHTAQAQAAKAELTTLLTDNKIIIQSKKMIQSFARFVADVYVVTDDGIISVTEHMKSKGFNIQQGQ